MKQLDHKGFNDGSIESNILESREAHDKDIVISLFDNVKAVHPRKIETTWTNFVQMISAGHIIHDSDKNNELHFNCVEYNDYRNTDNAIAITALMLDYDEGLSLEDAMQVFSGHEYIIFTSYNHQTYKYYEDGSVKDTPKDKFRIILPFDTPCPVKDWLMIKNHLDVFAPSVDRASKNITQLFCSNLVHSKNEHKALVHHNRGAFLKWSSWPKDEPTQRMINGELPDNWKPSEHEGYFDEEHIFRLKNGSIRAGDITEKVSNVYCPWHSDKSPGTFVNKSGNTVYHFCNKCGTHKMKGASDNASTQAAVQIAKTIMNLKRVADTKPDIGNSLIELHEEIIYKDRYVKQIRNVINSAYFVKSHKDSGKTTGLKEFVAQIRKQGKRILVIGHRRTLLKEMAHDLGLNYYLEADWHNDSDLKCIALCVNSMWRLENVFRFYDVIIIDESEQVIDHFVGSTIRPDMRGRIAKQLYKVIKQAKQVVCLDADLSAEKTIRFIMDIKGNDYPIDGSVNTWRIADTSINIWDKKSNIEDQIETCIKNGESIFLASNSKTFIDQWYGYINELGHVGRTMRITQENASTTEARDYLRELKNETVSGNRILLASPSLGTGINIQAVFDNVFGIFESGVNTHYDMDQQLRRVRNAKNVHIWITGKQFTLETDSQTIKKSLLENDKATRKLIDYNLSDTKEAWFDHLLGTYAQATADKNSSMNQLRKNFINLKKEQGYSVNVIEEIKDSKAHLDRKKLSAEERAQLKDSLSRAAVLENEDYFDMAKLRRKTTEQTQSLMRYRIEHEFGVNIDDEPSIVDWWFDRKRNLDNWQRFCTPEEELMNMDRQAMKNHIIDRPNFVLCQGYIKQGLKVLGLLNDSGGINVLHVLAKGEPNVVDFINWAQSHGEKIKDIVGIEVRGNNATNSPMAVVKNFIAKSGLKLVSRGRTMTDERNYISVYQVDENYLQWLSDTLLLKKEHKKYFEVD